MLCPLYFPYMSGVPQSNPQKAQKTFYLETFGCQMNVHDSERMAGLLDQAGYEATTEEIDAAQKAVITACSEKLAAALR